MKTTAIWSLLALNVILLLLFLVRSTGEAPALAQMSAARPGDYLMIPGEVTGGNNSVVYILDQTSRSLSALVYDDSMKRINSMPPIDLDRVINGKEGRRQPR